MENYKGVKFSSSLLPKTIDITDEIRELIYWCGFYSENNLAPLHSTGSFGNLSIRTKSGEIFITGTGIDLGKATSGDNFVEIIDCDFDKKIVYAEGRMNPSSESMLHFLIYKNRPEINAVFHGHNSEICSKANKIFKETLTEEAYGTIELVNSAASLIYEDIFILKNHGFFLSASSIEAAGKLSQKLLGLL